MSTKTRSELITFCKEHNIRGYSGKKKDDIIALIKSYREKEQPTRTVSITKPLLKWVGGKTQILDTVLGNFPTKMVNYHEPFVGGGSVLLGLLSYMKQGRIEVSGSIYASDLNYNLINFYKNIQSKPTEVIVEVKRLVEQFSKITGTTVNRKASNILEASTSHESYYYWVRSQFNSLSDDERTTPTASAMLLFMNKTCFRGIYREGPKGFNVPYGNYKNPTILDEDHVKEVSGLMKDVVFTYQDFSASLNNIKKGDFVYLDPPYAPETATSFVGYTSKGFELDKHNELFNMCNELNKQDIKLLMSNADVSLVKKEFPSPAYITQIISCRRAIHSKKPGSVTNEVLIKN